MPEYTFTNHDESEYLDVFFHMNDEKRFVGPDGKEWRRVYTSPNASIDSSTNIDPNSSRDFVEKTGKKRGNYGDLLSLSAELSAKRAAKEGKDPVKEKWLNTYETTNNTKFFDSSKDKVVEKNGVTIDFGAK